MNLAGSERICTHWWTLRNIAGIFKRGLLWQWLPHNSSLDPWGTYILIDFRGTCDTFGFLCLLVFLQKPSLSSGTSCTHPTSGGSQHSEEHPSEHLPFSKAMKADDSENPKRQRCSDCHGNSESKKGTDNMGWRPFSMGFSSMAGHSPGDHGHGKWGFLHQGGFAASSFCLTQAHFCSSSSSSSSS